MSFELKHGPGNPRNSEGSFVELKDGRILLTYTKYYGEDDWADHAAANIVSIVSSDGGKTWGNEKIVVRNDAQNVMSTSMLRLQDGRIALLYAKKTFMPGTPFIDCRPFICFSSDEAETWSSPVDVAAGIPPVYFVVNNDRMIQLKNGRLLVPAAMHPYLPGGDFGFSCGAGIAHFLISDDAGKTWRQGKHACYPPAWVNSGLQEPGVIELADGRLLGWARTDAECQYKFCSFDQGETWTTPVPAQEFPGPCGPLSMKRDPVTGNLVAIWNDYNPARSVPPKDSSWGRTPLVMAFSKDEGETWTGHTVLENDPACGYCYIAMLFRQKELVLEYCYGGKDDGVVLQDSRIRVVQLP